MRGARGGPAKAVSILNRVRATAFTQLTHTARTFRTTPLVMVQTREVGLRAEGPKFDARKEI